MYLDRCVDAAYGNERQLWVALNDVDNAAIPFQDVMQLSRVFSPDEEIAVVRPGHDVLVLRAKEIDY